MYYILECPKLLSIKVKLGIDEKLFLFDLYYQMSNEEVMTIFRDFPYLFLLQNEKIQHYLGEFQKY